jgi:hypothetical protein
MLTSSIVLVMIVNTVAASTAPLVALLASAPWPQTIGVATTDVGPVHNHLRSMTGCSRRERFLWLGVRRPAGETQPQ